MGSNIHGLYDNGRYRCRQIDKDPPARLAVEEIDHRVVRRLIFGQAGRNIWVSGTEWGG